MLNRIHHRKNLRKVAGVALVTLLFDFFFSRLGGHDTVYDLTVLEGHRELYEFLQL